MDFLRGSTNTWYFLESMNDPNLIYFPIFNKHWVLFDQSCPNLPPFCCQRMIVNLSRSLVIVPPRWYQPSIQGIAWYCIVLYDVSTSHPRPPLPTCPSMISDGCNPTNSSVIPALTSPLPLIHRGRGEGGVGWEDNSQDLISQGSLCPAIDRSPVLRPFGQCLPLLSPIFEGLSRDPNLPDNPLINLISLSPTQAPTKVSDWGKVAEVLWSQYKISLYPTVHSKREMERINARKQ